MLKDLYTIIEQYASQWEKLGEKLGLQQYHIKNILSDNTYNRYQSVACCRRVLEKWLESDSSSTWGKLDNIIKLLPTSLGSVDYKGTVYL